jgi:hypothetical protein
MKSRGKGFYAKALTAVLGVLLLMPVGASAQWGWGQNDDRRDRRRERREERRERRQERREERRERRDDRWDNRDDRWSRYGQYGGSFQLRQTALNAGYNNGIQEGRKDRQRGERFDYRDESDYRNATEDYSSRLGDRGLYQRYFREGFANGYEDGYRGY